MFLFTLLLHKVLEDTVKVRVTKKNPLLTILLIGSLLLDLSEHFISKILMLLTVANFNDGL